MRQIQCLPLLRQLVSIQSVNPFRVIQDGAAFRGVGCETDMNLTLESILRDVGFEVERQVVCPALTLKTERGDVALPERWNILATKTPRDASPSKGSLLFLAHTDTVDVKQGWKTDPFTIHVASHEGRERWYGLGANDMKGGIAAIVDACSLKEPEGYTLKVAFVVDEEFYSFGADVLCRSSFLDDVRLALAPEIGDNTKDVSTQWIGLGRLGRSEYEIEITGKACHGADAFIRADAVNAVHAALNLGPRVVQHCESKKKDFSVHGVEATNSAYVSLATGGSAMLSVPDKAVLVIDRTFVPEEDPESELEELRALVAKAKGDGLVDERTHIDVRPRPRPSPPCLPYFVSPESPEAQFVIKTSQQHSPKVSLGIGRSVADENRLAARGIPTFVLGPFGAGSHTPEEWVDPASVERVASIYASLIDAFGVQSFSARIIAQGDSSRRP